MLDVESPATTLDRGDSGVITPYGRKTDHFGRNQGEIQTADAHLAALAIEHGGEVCSSDTDFSRFRGLRWTHPLT